ncbi:MAG: hypothetical protein V3R62_05660, partial [Acidiferrobacterales bacterium]
ALNARGIKTARGRQWAPATVRNVLLRQTRADTVSDKGVKPSLAPVRNEMLNASGSRRIMLENLVKATARSRRWYATTVKNVLDRANVEGVKEAA